VSVFATGRVDIRPWSGYTNRAFPIASWIAQGIVTGDATGGSTFITLIFELSETDFRTSQMYNLEQLSIHIGNASGNFTGSMTTRAMDRLAPARDAAEQKWGFLIAPSGTTEAAVELHALAALPIWLGAPNEDFSVDSGLRFSTPNVDGNVVEVTAQGYVWGPRSILAEGGPQRPPNGIFR